MLSQRRKNSDSCAVWFGERRCGFILGSDHLATSTIFLPRAGSRRRLPLLMDLIIWRIPSRNTAWCVSSPLRAFGASLTRV